MDERATPKRVLLVPDGMADEPIAELDGRTPLAVAHTPNMDAMARRGTVGLVHTVPDGMPPGSDVANLAVLGYDPAAVYSGRSPLEAASIGVDLGPHDVSYRCNFVTIVDGVMKDHAAGHISTDESRRCIAALEAALGGGAFEFYTGVSYRNLLVWRGGEVVACTPPHNILDQPVADYLPGVAAGQGDESAARTLADLWRRSEDVLKPVRPETSTWFWGEGTAPSMPHYSDLYGLSGAVVGAVDLIRGIGRYAGFEVLDVPGATGGLDTDYGAKAQAAIDALDRHDFVWVHVEAPDEAGHMGSLEEKLKAIERIDAEVLGPILASQHRPGVLVVPDHFTLLRTRTHLGAPVPFVFASGNAGECADSASYTEAGAEATGVVMSSGRELVRLFFEATK
ncbi:MAG: cofactor-independent phosphoglycerate mutase [Thermoleophilia bacterium]